MRRDMGQAPLVQSADRFSSSMATCRTLRTGRHGLRPPTPKLVGQRCGLLRLAVPQ